MLFHAFSLCFQRFRPRFLPFCLVFGLEMGPSRADVAGSKRIYIFGGFDGNKWLNDLHVLDVGRLEDGVHILGKTYR